MTKFNNSLTGNNHLPKKLSMFVWHFLQPYRWVVALYIFLALLAGFWSPFNSMLIKHMINILSDTTTKDVSLLTMPAILLVLNFVVFDNVTWRGINYLNYKFQPLIKNQILNQTFDYVLGASQQYFSDTLSGKIASQITTLADSIEQILYPIFCTLLRGVSLLIIAMVTMYFINYKFFCVLVIWSVVFCTFSVSMSKRLINLSDIYAESQSVLSGQIVDCITNVSNIRFFAKRNYETQRLSDYLRSYKNKFQNKEMLLLLILCTQGILIAIMMGFMLYFLMKLYAINEITIGDFALIIGLNMEVGYVSWWTMSQVDAFNQAVGKCKQSLRSLIKPQEIIDNEEASTLIVKHGTICFENVNFYYRDTVPLFNSKSITIQAGQKVGLVGYSGSGKSTFVNLILRLYSIAEGHIYIDNQDIKDVTQDSLRTNISLIPQDPTLFNRTLMENIRYGKTNATDEEVIEAAKKAHAHEFISKLPLGYQSLVGERGIKLSGGQRQRIAIARATLKNAPILILDEATSQLDSITEVSIQKSLYELMQDKTTIVIAHRLSTLSHMDRILVFNEGKIVEDGSNEELLRLNGLYKTLWNTQVGGFLPDKKI